MQLTLIVTVFTHEPLQRAVQVHFQAKKGDGNKIRILRVHMHSCMNMPCRLTQSNSLGTDTGPGTTYFEVSSSS